MPFAFICSHCHDIDAPVETGAGWLNTAVTPYMQGLLPEARPELLGYNSGILCIVVAMLLLVIFNIRQYPRFFSTLVHDLWSLRERNHLFDTRTVNETRTVVVCVIQVCVCEALLALAALNMYMGIPPDRLAAVTALLAGMALLYYVWQLAAYSYICYVFYDKYASSLWLRGFNASQIMLGAALLVPALAVLFYPSATGMLLIAGVLLYFTARVIFICKGVRIFYQNFDSLLYFILYLCSVEIIPLILLFNGTFSLCCNLIS